MLKFLRAHQDRLKAVNQLKNLPAGCLENCLNNVLNPLRANWAGIYLIAEKKYLLVEKGAPVHPIEVSYFDEVRLLSGKPVCFEQGYAQPLKIQEHIAGYLLIETQAPDQENLIKAYGELVGKELENEVNKKLINYYAAQADYERQRLKKVREHHSIIMEMTAHDLSSPISAVSGYIELIGDSINNNEGLDVVQSYYEKISIGISDISAILHQFNDIKQLKSNKEKENTILTNINWIVRDITDLFLVKARNKSIDLICTMPEQPLFVYADVVKLKRSVMNLVSNAIKFSKEIGTVAIELCKEKEEVVIKVTDNGIGIPEEKQKSIFEPFIQVSKNSLEKDPSSVGLGLYITTNFVHEMNGRIKLQSIYGEGSCFAIYLPLAQSTTDFQ
ncbi:MAG: HAMP domain-containing sensor histidine kinase [Balneolaceae bacterium]